MHLGIDNELGWWTVSIQSGLLDKSEQTW